jgi:hypothetical protein
MPHGFNTIKDILEVLVIPLVLLLIGKLIIWWDQKRKEKEFLKLIIRELEELKPHPLEKKYDYEWCKHLEKRFIHESIFINPSSNTDFILSIDPDIVYFLTQMWIHFDKANSATKPNKDSEGLTEKERKNLLFDNGTQWIYFLGKICYLLTHKYIGNFLAVANPFSKKMTIKKTRKVIVKKGREVIIKKDFNFCKEVFEPWRKLLLEYDERFEKEFEKMKKNPEGKNDKNHCLQHGIPM